MVAILKKMMRHTMGRMMKCPDVQKCIDAVEDLVNHELDPKTEKIVKFKAEICMRCFKQHEIDSAVKLALQKKLERKQVPEDLLESIKSKIQGSQG